MEEVPGGADGLGITNTFCEFPKPDTGWDDALNGLNDMRSLSGPVCDLNGCPNVNNCFTWEDIRDQSPCLTT